MRCPKCRRVMVSGNGRKQYGSVDHWLKCKCGYTQKLTKITYRGKFRRKKGART